MRRTRAKVSDTGTPLPFREGMRYGRQQGLFRSEPGYAGESGGESVSYNNRLLRFREETAVARNRSAPHVPPLQSSTPTTVQGSDTTMYNSSTTAVQHPENYGSKDNKEYREAQ
ncbi:MAG TPA: hypothetical protein VGM30_17025 [Puia sp.]